ncbi:MAG TPA: HEAT repeat domain-containing protein [Luteolibacter sp.]|nr:HEAT repeat domain-containing protein [Luteolibacter sp.]
MEILNQNMSVLAWNAGLLLMALSVALVLVIAIVHWRAERRRRHTLEFDQVNEPLVMSYLEGHVPQIAVIGSMGGEPSEAMDLLMELSRKLQPTAQSRLLPIFAGLPGVDQEVTALESPHAKRRLQAAERLAFLKNESSTEALLHALGDEVVAVRYGAARSLAAHGKPETIEPTLKAFDARHEINWFRLVEIILEYGPAASPVLLSMLANPDWSGSGNILHVVIRSLGLLKERRAVEPLIGMLNHTDIGVRLNAARALGDIGDPQAIEPVSGLSHDPDWAVRKKAVEAIGKLHAETQMPVLEEALSDPSWWVRFTAAEALYALGAHGIDRLKEIRRNTHDIYVHDICSQVLSEHDVHNQKANPS